MLCGCYLQQAEHGVAYVEAVPPVVIGDGPVTLPHCVHPFGQRLGWREGRGGYRIEQKGREEETRGFQCDVAVLLSCPSAQGNPLCLHSYITELPFVATA